MPELPEVETVARDLRGLVVGARIKAVRVSWLKTLRSQDPEAFARAVVGREIVGTTRRAKLVVLELDDASAITIHLKMTGQLFVLRSGRPDDPYVRLVIEFEDGRELRFRDIRKFGRVGVAGRNAATGDLEGELGGPKGFKGFGPEPLDPAFTARVFRKRIRARKGRLKPLLLDQAFIAGVGNIYADEALWAARLHPLRSAASLRPADEGRLYRELVRILAEAVERRGSSIDDYTAPDGDGEMQERLLVYQRSGEPCPRCGRPVRRIVIGARSTHFCSWCQRLPAGERRARRRSCAAWSRSRGVREAGQRGVGQWREPRDAEHPPRPALDRDRRLGRLPGDPDRLDARAAASARRTDRAASGPGAPPRVGTQPGVAGERPGRRPRLMSILRLEGVHREIGTFVILDRIDAALALGDRIGLVGPNGAGKTTLLQIAAGRTSPTPGGSSASGSCRSACWRRRRNSTTRSWPRRTCARRSGTARRPRGDGRRVEALEHAGRATEPAYEALQHRYEVLGGYTLDQRVDRPCRARVRARRADQAAHRRACPVASRPGPRWRAW